jgi:hypothetical protein
LRYRLMPCDLLIVPWGKLDVETGEQARAQQWMLTQTRLMTTVMRFRFLSATPDEPKFEVTPPPNMSDRPPPATLVKQNHQGQQNTCQGKEDLKNDLNDFHNAPLQA